MKPVDLIGPLGFIAKVLVISVLIAIAFKTIGPRLPLPATSAVSLAIVLTPSIVIGLFLTWQLWTANDADPTHSGSDQRKNP